MACFHLCRYIIRITGQEIPPQNKGNDHEKEQCNETRDRQFSLSQEAPCHGRSFIARNILIYQASSAFITLVYAFVADVHLKPGNTSDKRHLISWIRTVKEQAQQIYILGDLFDYWYTGMDLLFEEVLEELHDPLIHLIPGNRDFLLNNCRDARIDVSRTEEVRLSLYGIDVLIAHGHTLTEGDCGFKFVHACVWPVLRLLDRVLPLRLKDACGRFLVSSSASVRPLHAEITDRAALVRGVETVICGHLHRSVVTEHLIVLPAFFHSASWLSWDETGPRFCTFSKGRSPTANLPPERC